MCGINGIFSFSREGSFGEELKRMNDSLAHRGPDDEGVFTAPGIALGHRRLSIIDLSPAGHQPMYYANGRYTIVYNGELYNYRELRSELNELPFVTSSDTEVILAAYSKWGKDCLSRFNGMFALAIWDTTEQTLFVARDRLGIKPLYWFRDEKQFAFSSELRSLAAGRFFKAKLNAAALNEYLLYQTVHAPATILEDVQMLMPGQYMFVTVSGIDFHIWWKPEIKQAPVPDYKEVCSDVRSLLRAAVERRLVADVPFGAFLSGGIDSSAIVGLMSEVAASKVKTFSVVFDDSEFSEAVYARQVARKFATEHHEIKLAPEDFLRDLPDALDAMDHPGGDGPNTYVVSKATKNAGITMALSGLGGDEIFAGYDVFKRISAIEQNRLLHLAPRFARKAGAGLIRSFKKGVAAEKMAVLLSQKEIRFEEYYPVFRQALSEEQVRAVLRGKDRFTSPVTKIISDFPDPGKDHLLSRVSAAEIQTYMQNVLLRDTDQMSMAHALEVRVPFLDYTLVEYVLGLPDKMKFPHTPKKLLVDALGDLLPPEIVNRPKMGFTFPWKKWMKNELRGFCEERLENLGRRDPFDANGIRQLWQSFLADDPRVTWSRIWPMVVLSHWLEKNGIDA